MIEYIINFLETNFSNKIALMLISALPLVEIKGAIPIGHAMEISPRMVYILSFLGSIIPVPFILHFIRPIFDIMKRNETLAHFIDKIKSKANSKKVYKQFSLMGLFIFVAIPLPSTGVWMASLIASILKIDKLKAFTSIFCGNIIACLIVSVFSHILI